MAKQLPTPDGLNKFLSSFPKYGVFLAENWKKEILKQAKVYAKEVVKHTLQEAANNAATSNKSKFKGDINPIVDEQSILSLEDKIIKDLKL